MIVKDAAWIAAGQAIVVIAGLAGTRVLTTLLPPAVYGQLSLIIGLGALGTGLFCMPFLQAAMRSFPDARLAGKVGALRGLAAGYVQRGVLAAALLLALAGATWTLWSDAPVQPVVFLVAAGVVAADAWRSFESGLLNGARRQRDFATRTALDALARPAAAVLLVWWLGPAALYVLLGFAVGSVTLSLLLRQRTVRGLGEVPSLPNDPWLQNHKSEFLRYALPLVPMAAMNWVMSMGDRYFLNASWGAETVGIYWAAYALGSQPFIAVNALLHSTLRPIVYEAVAQGDDARERRTLRVLLGLALAVGGTGWLLITALAEPLCKLLLGPAFQSAAELLPWIGAAYALQMVQQAFEVILYAHRQSRQLVLLQAIAAVSAVGLFLWLIPELAGRGAALGTLGSVLVTTAVAIWLSGAPRKLFGSVATRG